MRKPLPQWAWTLLAAACVIVLGLLDGLTGFELNFFVFYFLPVWLGAWYVGVEVSVAMAVLSALVWYAADLYSGHVYTSTFFAVWNTTVRLISYLLIGWLVCRVRSAFERERRAAEAAKKLLSEVKVLEAFLPICCQCKKIRDQQGHWQRLEEYIGEHTNTQFSHGYCPDCAKRAMEDAGMEA